MGIEEIGAFFGYMSLASLLIAITYMVVYWLSKFLQPECKVQEYISWYKIGRVKQFATENKINIEEVIAEDTLREKKKIQESWTEVIENKLMEDLKSIEKVKDKKNG
jgi:hypothetical protein